jgi:hypothetical protein
MIEVPPPPATPPRMAPAKKKAVKETRYTFTQSVDKTFRAIKMSPQGETLDVYKLSANGVHCSCPASVYCRHQKMLVEFREQNKVGTGWSLIYETGEWIPPEKIDKAGGLYEGLFDDDEPANLIDI